MLVSGLLFLMHWYVLVAWTSSMNHQNFFNLNSTFSKCETIFRAKCVCVCACVADFVLSICIHLFRCGLMFIQLANWPFNGICVCCNIPNGLTANLRMHSIFFVNKIKMLYCHFEYVIINLVCLDSYKSA